MFNPQWDAARARQDMAQGLKVREFTDDQVKEFHDLSAEVDRLTDDANPVIGMFVIPNYGEMYKRNPCPHEKGYHRSQCIECGIAWLREVAIGLAAVLTEAKAHARGEKPPQHQLLN